MKSVKREASLVKFATKQTNGWMPLQKMVVVALIEKNVIVR